MTEEQVEELRSLMWKIDDLGRSIQSEHRELYGVMYQATDAIRAQLFRDGLLMLVAKPPANSKDEEN